jgi:Fur family transcriptional regulator, ferric uptake regulator
VTNRGSVGEDLHRLVDLRLRAIGQRYTRSRRVLIEVLARADRPLTTAEILSRRRELPQSSAYRNLMALEQADAVRRVSGNDQTSRYELAEDLIGHHHHLVCSSCGAVEDFPPSPQLEQAMDRAMRDVARSSRFAPDTHHVQLRGLCSTCAC